MSPTKTVGGSLFYMDQHDELLLGCHTRLAGTDKAATFTSKALANEFLSAVLPTLRQRHGDATEANVLEVTFSAWSEDERDVVKLYEKAKAHAIIVKARIKANDFRPNVYGPDGKLKLKYTRRIT